MKKGAMCLEAEEGVEVFVSDPMNNVFVFCLASDVIVLWLRYHHQTVGNAPVSLHKFPQTSPTPATECGRQGVSLFEARHHTESPERDCVCHQAGLFHTRARIGWN